jgi:hypothetical protein
MEGVLENKARCKHSSLAGVYIHYKLINENALLRASGRSRRPNGPLSLALNNSMP